MKQSFSVLMSLYDKEKAEYARQCFDSLLNQTVRANEWVIVEDGPLTDELYALLDEYESKNVGLIKRVALKENVGLGMALREGVLNCSNELIARMDTDDISRPDRFELQLKMFEDNPSLDVCGSYIQEFDVDPQVPLSVRQVPLEQAEILEYQKRRDSFNHMTVMYKKSAVLSAGNYQQALLMEDSLLWVNMMKNGAQCANIGECLVYARTGAGMIERRGGLSYYKKYKQGRKKIYQTGYISWWDYAYTLIVQFAVAIMPKKLRKFVFNKLLRK